MHDLFGTIVNCWQLVREAEELIDLCQSRGSRFEDFQSYMELVVGVLKGLRPYLVLNARPIARHIQKEIQQGRAKVDKYSNRGPMNAAWHARQEDGKLNSIKSRIQQLLLMLVAVNTGGEQLEALESNLKKQLEEHVGTTHAHLQSVQGQLERLHAVVAAAVQPSSQNTANEVQRKLEELNQGQQTLSAQVMHMLAGVCGELQTELASAVMRLEKPLMKLQESQDAWMIQLRKAVFQEKQELQQHVRDMGRDVVADLRKEHEETRRVVVEQSLQIQGVVVDQGEQTRQHMDMLHKGLVTRIVERIVKLNASDKGEADMPVVSSFLRCRATNLPFTRSGDGMPVLLLACGCSMSRLAANKAGQGGKCPFCDAALAGAGRLFVVDDRMRRLVMADRCGEELPRLERADIELGQVLGRGAEGRVFRATYRGQPVAVKELEVLPDARRQVEDVLWTMLLASSCKQVCTLYGVCWEEDESRVLLVMDLCVATLETAVRTGSPKGWPTADVIGLGLELLEALHAVHNGARALHLDVKPANVLLTEARTVVLADFGICKHMPPMMTNQTLTSVQQGTPGFAAHEQFLEGRASPATDIYGLGVTLVYAACGHNPWSRKNALQLTRCMDRGERLPVPDSIQADLRALLVDMTEPERASRPSLHAVRTRLQCLLEAEAVAPKHIQPCWQVPHRRKLAQQGGSLKPASVCVRFQAGAWFKNSARAHVSARCVVCQALWHLLCQRVLARGTRYCVESKLSCSTVCIPQRKLPARGHDTVACLSTARAHPVRLDSCRKCVTDADAFSTRRSWPDSGLALKLMQRLHTCRCRVCGCLCTLLAAVLLAAVLFAKLLVMHGKRSCRAIRPVCAWFAMHGGLLMVCRWSS